MVVFGVRHLSPGGAWHVRQLLDRKKPKLVLVEGPSDLNAQMKYITDPKTKPPIAILAYTKSLPIQTILYPFAEYSPEYQAILWARQNKSQCRFIDLPSGAFLSLARIRDFQNVGEEQSISVYQLLNEKLGEDGHETFWERTLEHSLETDGYLVGASEFGKQIREVSKDSGKENAENIVREAYMKRQIENAIKEGYKSDEIVVITGAFHVEGIKTALPMSDDELKSLPMCECEKTLMPYSYFRLSSRSGYGAGNKAPAYYEMLWKALNEKDINYTSYSYLSRIASYQRKLGNPVSSAEVIEGVQLARSLANLKGYNIPALRDLRDAAVTCLGHGSLSEISVALADTEIGTKIGTLPKGVSRTSIQENFYRIIEDLNLTRFQSVIQQEIQLDLREKLTVKSQKAAFLDLERSFFLHKLRVLGINFAFVARNVQDKATWAEKWALRWTPEAEIEIVEAALKGDTIAQAASFEMKERVEKSINVDTIASVIEDAFLCGMPETASYATAALQKMTVNAVAIENIAETAHRLSIILSYGSIRKVDPAPIRPIMKQLFLRGLLIAEGSCACDNNAVSAIITALNQLNEVSITWDYLDSDLWLNKLEKIANRDDINPKASGFATAILLERSVVDSNKLATMVQLRLSKGIPADLGSLWFEGLSMKNRYSLIARLSLWEKLNEYLDTLDDEEFKRALLFLRRAFADYSSKEKGDIAENLGEVWGLNKISVSAVISENLKENEKKIIEDLDEFDFDDI